MRARELSNPTREPLCRAPSTSEALNANVGSGLGICRRKDKLLKRHARRAGTMSGARESPTMPSCYNAVEARPLARLFPIRPLSTVMILLLALIVEPTGDVTRWNRSSWEVRNNSAGVDDQSLVKFRSREVFGFPLSLKRPGRARASPSKQCTAPVHLESNIPSIWHLSPKDGASGDVASTGPSRDRHSKQANKLH
jgi:hypothetical protein